MCCMYLATAQYYSVSSYPPDYHGTKVQSGQRYSKFLNTAAHYNIPLDSKVLLTERKTGRSVVVVVNDRIEEASSDFILSDAAYEALGLQPGSTIEVKYKILEEGMIHEQQIPKEDAQQVAKAHFLKLLEVRNVSSVIEEKIYLQLGAFSTYSSAARLISTSTDKGLGPLWITQSQSGIYRVLTGAFDTKLDAATVQEKLKKKSFSSILKTGKELLNN